MKNIELIIVLLIMLIVGYFSWDSSTIPQKVIMSLAMIIAVISIADSLFNSEE